MSISQPFIRRPVATLLLSVALVCAGLFAYRFLPVAALPRVDFPTISVSAQLPGAAPETMANSVATPLIKEFSIIPAIQTISATSVQGSVSITIEFNLNRNIDQAAADVQAAIARTQRRLPAEMTTPPSYRKTCAFWVGEAKRPETRERRFAELVEACGRGERLSRYVSNGAGGRRGRG